jgi:chemotaxis protein methyltransferase CheR
MRPDNRIPAAPKLPLAQGDLTPGEVAELHELKRLIQQHVGLLCDGYKEKCLRRRIAVRMRARGVHSYTQYAALVEQDAEERRRLHDAITINVSKFFRNADMWKVLRRDVVPALCALPAGPVRIWSAGVACGEEAYSMAMLLREYAETNAVDIARFCIVGTDIDRDCLAAAARAEYGSFAFTETAAAVRDRWFERTGLWRVRPEVRAMVEFDTLDLLRDRFPAGQHLIFCRNVIIYFERRVQQELFERFREALAPGGYLVLGKVEALFGPAAAAFRPVAGRERVFQLI